MESGIAGRAKPLSTVLPVLEASNGKRHDWLFTITANAECRLLDRQRANWLHPL
jgi:hypothetical protein